MPRLVNRDDLDRAKSKFQGKGSGIRRTFFTEKYPTKTLTFLAPTFSLVLKDEQSLDGLKMEYDQQFQIMVMNGRWKNLLTLWLNEFIVVAEAIEKAGGDHLDLDGKTYEISMKFPYKTEATAKLVEQPQATEKKQKKPKPAAQEPEEKPQEIDDEKLLELALDVYQDGYKPFQLVLWLKERLENEGLTATDEQVKAVSDEVCKAKSK
jgi:hypothetical protein